MKTKMFKLSILLILTFAAGACTKPQVNAPKKDTTEFARNYAESWSSGDPNSVAAFFAENGSLQVNDDKPAVGRAAIVKVASGFMTAFPGMVVSLDKVVEKAGVTEFHWTLDGRNTGPDGTGKRVRISGYEEWKMDADGLIAESKGHLPEDEYKRQLEHGYQE